jgi:hypothetical protein
MLLKGLRKTMRYQSKCSQSSGRESNPALQSAENFFHGHFPAFPKARYNAKEQLLASA